MAQASWPGLFVEQLEGTREENAQVLVESFVHERRAEDLYLDFIEKKDPARAELSDDDRRNYAKAISGFAHSDGGVVVWGIAARKEKKGDPESPDVAFAKRPIANLRAFHSNLNDYVWHATTPPVDGVRNIPIWENKNQGRGYLVTYVPVGLNPPYRAPAICNNHFYKRAGSRFYPMEPYDIRDVIFRFSYPKIQLAFDREDLHVAQDKHVYSLGISIRNAGPRILESWKIVVEIPQILLVQVPQQLGQIGFAERWSPDHSGQVKQLSFVSHPRKHPIWVEFIPILPEDELKFAGKDAARRLSYSVTNEIFHHHLPQTIRWRFYAEQAPMQAGTIHLKEAYEPGEINFCNF